MNRAALCLEETHAAHKLRVKKSSAHIHITDVPVEEPSTASKADVSKCSKRCREVWSYSITRFGRGERTGPEASPGLALGHTHWHPAGLGERFSGRALTDCKARWTSLQVEEVLQEALNVFMGFVRRRFLVVAARKSFFITRIAWRKRLLRLVV
jgi:hypothetical protein